MTLVRSVQISKCDCDWYACNHQLGESQLYFMCSAESPQQWKANSTLLHAKERPKRPQCDHAEHLFFPLWEVLLWKFSFLNTKFKPSLMSFIWVKKQKGPTGKRNNQGLLVKTSFEKGVQHWGMKVLWFTTICKALSNITEQPLPFFLIHSVKLQHNACVSAPASAMNTNTACGHGLCYKSAKKINIREERLEQRAVFPGRFLCGSVTQNYISGSTKDTGFKSVQHSCFLHFKSMSVKSSMTNQTAYYSY